MSDEEAKANQTQNYHYTLKVNNPLQVHLQ